MTRLEAIGWLYGYVTMVIIVVVVIVISPCTTAYGRSLSSGRSKYYNIQYVFDHAPIVTPPHRDDNDRSPVSSSKLEHSQSPTSSEDLVRGSQAKSPLNTPERQINFFVFSSQGRVYHVTIPGTFVEVGK